MIDFLIINATYVAYRLLVSAHIVKFFNRYVSYYWAVLIMSQFSFAYDNGLFAYLFSAQDLPRLIELFYADLMYTLRVFAAWVIIKWLWEKLNNYYVAVFIGAELTFIVDYFLLGWLWQ